MKKSLRRMISVPLTKLKQHKEQIKRFNLSKLSAYKEDFVITAQEEREGGFFGSRLKMKNAI